jgi:Fe-S-cluster containining protein
MPSDDAKSTEELFQCRQCGDCCKGYGGTYVTREDIAAISRYVGSDPHRFIAEYCALSGKRFVLAQRSDGYCIFWDKLCSIHPVKPQMCRRWPFLDSILVDPSNWLIMADSCPGIHSDVSPRALQAYIKNRLAQDR